MAYEGVCPVCGAEIKGGITGNSWKIAGNHICLDCSNKYQDRFNLKYANMKKALGKKEMKNFDKFQLFLDYAKEGSNYQKYEDFKKEKRACFYLYDEDLSFTVDEYDKDEYHKDVNYDKYLHCKMGDRFTKNDISMLEYELKDKFKPTSKYTIYRVVFRFNDETKMTYKPCLVGSAVIVKGLFGIKKKAIQAAGEQLQQFKQDIGIDLPIKYIEF